MQIDGTTVFKTAYLMYQVTEKVKAAAGQTIARAQACEKEHQVGGGDWKEGRKEGGREGGREGGLGLRANPLLSTAQA